MKLVASLIVRNELGRYLEPCIASLLDFCDEVRVLDDGSDDDTADTLAALERVTVRALPFGSFYAHEGHARNALLEWTLVASPTHVLAIDADEFVTDGPAIRRACEEDAGTGAWSLTMEEVWRADTAGLWTRQDGGWRQHPVPILWRAPARKAAQQGAWRIADKALACGREPLAVRRLRPVVTGASVLHFGWANEAERQARYDRYATHDGGRFHASAHLQSILWPARKVRLRRRPWPEGLDREAILPRAGHVAEAV